MEHSSIDEQTRAELAEPRVAPQEVYSQRTSYYDAPTPLGQRNSRLEMMQETYRLLAVAVFCSMASAWLASQSLPLVKMLVTTPGLIASFFAINFVPQLARRALGKDSKTGTIVLALDGILSGIAIAPLIFVALAVSGLGEDTPNLVQSALVITAFSFLGISAYVYKSGSQYRWSGGLASGAAWCALGLVTVNLFSPGISLVTMLLLGVVGLLGILQILYGTAKVLNDPDYNDPISGALILFAGLFNLFSVILRLLLSGGRRD